MKNSLLNIVTTLLGAFLIYSGLQKMSGNFTGIEFGLGNGIIKVESHDSLFYIIVINFVGGLAMCYHAITTYHFKRPLIDKFAEELKQISADTIQPDNISKLSMAGGIISLIVGIWFIIELIVLMTGFENVNSAFYIFALILILINAPFAVLPIILVGKNLALSSRLGQIVENQQKAEIRARAQSTRKIRR